MFQARRRKDRRQLTRKGTGLVGKILGEDHDDDNSSLFPDGAEDLGNSGREKAAAGNEVARDTSSLPEPLIDPAFALVAPDTTPNVDRRLDPTQLPKPATGVTPALSTVTGIPQDASPAPAAYPQPRVPTPINVESMLRLTGSADHDPESGDSHPQGQYNAVAAATQAGIPMPEHRPSNGRSVMESFRKLTA